MRWRLLKILRIPEILPDLSGRSKERERVELERDTILVGSRNFHHDFEVEVSKIEKKNPSYQNTGM